MAQRGGHPSHLLVKGGSKRRPFLCPFCVLGECVQWSACVLLPELHPASQGEGDSLFRCGGRQIRRQLPLERQFVTHCSQEEGAHQVVGGTRVGPEGEREWGQKESVWFLQERPSEAGRQAPSKSSSGLRSQGVLTGLAPGSGVTP